MDDSFYTATLVTDGSGAGGSPAQPDEAMPPTQVEPAPWTPLTRGQCLRLALDLHRQRRAERIMRYFA